MNLYFHTRFRNPVPKKPMNETFMAVKDGSMCVQYHFKQYKDEGNEDCLFLNVYTPQVKHTLHLCICT